MLTWIVPFDKNRYTDFMPRLVTCFFLFLCFGLLGMDALPRDGRHREQKDETLAFPQNRLRDFYRKQALIFIGDEDRNYSRPLDPFPGLDGGGWGHWGQNPESDNVDDRLNEMDFGGILMQATNYSGGWANKGVSIQSGKYTALFDPEKLCFVEAWEGGLPRWSNRRFGITSGVRVEGKKVKGFASCKWSLPQEIKSKYKGFYRMTDRVVFHYQIGEAKIYDWVGTKQGFRIHRYIQGKLPEGVVFSGNELLLTASDFSKPFEIQPAKARWSDKAVITRGKLGGNLSDSPYVFDTLTVPYRDSNPFKTPMRIGGIDALPDGQIAVCTIMGDVWLVDGVDDRLERLVWKRFASGLNQPLGLVVRDNQIHVIGRDQLTRLHDLNKDGEADFYECLTHEFPTDRGNSFALTLQQDHQGNFYWFTRSSDFGMTRYFPGSKPVSIATGLRGCNGTGVSSDGSIVFALPQEGTWQPSSAIFEVGNRSYHGFFGPKPEFGKHGYQMPLCFLPRGIDNSSGDLVFVPNDERMGPLARQMIGTSFGYCQHYLVLREVIDGNKVQGGVVPLPGEFLSGAHRVIFNSKDGHLYVAGTDGWQSYARENGSLERIRWTGGKMALPESVQTRKNGLIIRFNEFIDPKTLKKNQAKPAQWKEFYGEE